MAFRDVATVLFPLCASSSLQACVPVFAPAMAEDAAVDVAADNRRRINLYSVCTSGLPKNYLHTGGHRRKSKQAGIGGVGGAASGQPERRKSVSGGANGSVVAAQASLPSVGSAELASQSTMQASRSASGHGDSAVSHRHGGNNNDNDGCHIPSTQATGHVASVERPPWRDTGPVVRVCHVHSFVVVDGTTPLRMGVWDPLVVWFA